MDGSVGQGDDPFMTTTVVIVDDHPGFRAFARALLQAERAWVASPLAS